MKCVEIKLIFDWIRLNSNSRESDMRTEIVSCILEKSEI